MNFPDFNTVLASFDQAKQLLTSGTNLVQQITLLLTAIAALSAAWAALWGRPRPPAPPAAMTAPAENEDPVQALRRQVGFVNLLEAERRHSRQANWNGLAGDWLLPIAVIMGTVYLAASITNLVTAKVPFGWDYADYAVGLVLTGCWCAERWLDPDRLLKMPTLGLILDRAVLAIASLCAIFLAVMLIAPFMRTGAAVAWGVAQWGDIVGLLVAACWFVERRYVPSSRAVLCRKRVAALNETRHEVEADMRLRLDNSPDAPVPRQIQEQIVDAVAKATRAEERMRR